MTKDQMKQVLDALLLPSLKTHAMLAQREQAITIMKAAMDVPETEPVASIYITPTGEREMDDWKCGLHVGRNELYAAPTKGTP